MEEQQFEDFAEAFSFEAGPGGQGQPDTSGGERFTLPRVDTSKFKPPEKNTDKRQNLALMQALGAVGAVAGAAGDDPLLTQIGAGLSQGAGQGVTQIDESFAARQEAYQEFLRGAEQTNTELAARGMEARLDQQLERKDRQLRRTIAEKDRELERELDQPTDLEQRIGEQEIETEKARQEKYREQGDAATVRARKYGQGRGSPDQSELPNSVDDLESLRDQIRAEVQAIRGQIPTGTNTFGEPKQPVLRRQLSEKVADKSAQLAAIETKLKRVQDQQGTGGRGQNPGQTDPSDTGGDEPREDELMENRDTVFNRGNAAAPGPGAGQARGAGSSGRSGRSGQGQPATDDPVQIINRTLQQNGKVAAIDTLEQMMDDGRLTPRQAQQMANQLAPDSLRQ